MAAGARFDVVVAGLGAVGGAAAAHLARRGHAVLGLDRFAPPHDRGSSHGESRILREAYFEDPRYVPLVRRARALWEALGRARGIPLLEPTGGLMVGPPDGVLVRGALASALAHALAHEVLDAAAVRRRFPGLAPAPDHVAVWEPHAGVLDAEACVAAHLEVAREAGAMLLTHAPLRRWEADDAGVSVEWEAGSARAGALVLAAGAWMAALLPDLPLAVERQVQYWLAPGAGAQAFAPGRFPIFLLEHAPERFLYGFPARGGRVKVARHEPGEPADPGAARRPPDAGEIAALRALLRRFLPGLEGEPVASASCLYTRTPDGHFVLDRLPGRPRVIVASPCSGHGFKFASALGEAIADLVEGRAPACDLSLFRIDRFGQAADSAGSTPSSSRR